MRLSILICTIEGREERFEKILSKLNKQTTHEVEVLYEKDNCNISTGEKRNKLLDRSIGDYVCFVDDDDGISDNYISSILKATKGDPDCVGLEVFKYKDGKMDGIYVHSLSVYKNSGYAWYSNDKKVYMTPDHINPIKRDIALKVRFPDKSKSEDTEYSLNIMKHLNNENMSSARYFYFYENVEKEYNNKRNIS